MIWILSHCYVKILCLKSIYWIQNSLFLNEIVSTLLYISIKVKLIPNKVFFVHLITLNSLCTKVSSKIFTYCIIFARQGALTNNCIILYLKCQKQCYLYKWHWSKVKRMLTFRLQAGLFFIVSSCLGLKKYWSLTVT